MKEMTISPHAAAGWFAALMLTTGVVTGMEFVAASHLARQGNKEVGQTAARINSADHLGALIGALATGLLLVPALGFVGALLAFAGLKGMGALVCLLPSDAISRHPGS